MKQPREIEVTFIIRRYDTKPPEEQRESTAQFLDGIAYGIDTILKHSTEMEGYEIADATEISDWRVRNKFSKEIA